MRSKTHFKAFFAECPGIALVFIYFLLQGRFRAPDADFRCFEANSKRMKLQRSRICTTVQKLSTYKAERGTYAKTNLHAADCNPYLGLCYL